MKLLHWFVLMTVLCNFLLPSSVHTQQNIHIEQVEVNIWPEYDDSSVLVILRVILSPETTIPAQVTWRIPSEAGSPFNVAMKDVDGMLYNLEYSLKQEGEWLTVAFTALAPELQIEYYDSSMSIEEAHRKFTYVWPGDQVVESVIVQVQQPLEAQKLTIQPAMDNVRQGNDGLFYHALQVGAVEPGMTFEVSVEYDNPQNVLSQAGLQAVEPIQPLPLAQPAMPDLQNSLLWALGALGILLVVGGLFLIRRNSRRDERPRPRKPASGSGDDQVYCHQCGRRSNPGDIFCRACGTKLRFE